VLGFAPCPQEDERVAQVIRRRTGRRCVGPTRLALRQAAFMSLSFASFVANLAMCCSMRYST
jgi:hypothetical protein